MRSDFVLLIAALSGFLGSAFGATSLGSSGKGHVSHGILDNPVVAGIKDACSTLKYLYCRENNLSPEKCHDVFKIPPGIPILLPPGMSTQQPPVKPTKKPPVKPTEKPPRTPGNSYKGDDTKIHEKVEAAIKFIKEKMKEIVEYIRKLDKELAQVDSHEPKRPHHAWHSILPLPVDSRYPPPGGYPNGQTVYLPPGVHLGDDILPPPYTYPNGQTIYLPPGVHVGDGMLPPPYTYPNGQTIYLPPGDFLGSNINYPELNGILKAAGSGSERDSDLVDLLTYSLMEDTNSGDAIGSNPSWNQLLNRDYE